MGPSFGSGVTVLGANVLGRLLNCLAWDIALKTRMAPRKAPSKAAWLHYSSVEPSLLHKLECMYCREDTPFVYPLYIPFLYPFGARATQKQKMT